MRIICEHLSKSYRVKGHDFPVLDDISLETGEHDFVCVLGPNGCGKTTLLKLMAGLLKPTSGAVRYADVRNSAIPVSLIFQEHGLFPWLNIFDNICFHLEMKGLPKKERYAQARPFLESMGLERFLKHTEAAEIEIFDSEVQTADNTEEFLFNGKKVQSSGD